jgi:hypothetical protein
MRWAVLCLLAATPASAQEPLTAIVPEVAAAARLEQLLSYWEQTRGKARSLTVEFKIEHAYPVFDRKEEFDGRLKLLRLPGSSLRGFVELRPKSRPAEVGLPWLPGGPLRIILGASPQRPAEPFRAWLLDGHAYFLEPDQKRLLELHVGEVDLFDVLVRYLHPFVACTDKQLAKEQYRLTITKQDEWYTYIHVWPKSRKRTGWLEPALPAEGRIAVRNKDADGLPRNLPAQLWFMDVTGNTHRVDFTRWELDEPGAERAKEFQKPVPPPGWQVLQPAPPPTP